MKLASETRKVPYVSVIITTYNRADVLNNAIESVLSQMYKNIEIIVVDDGSNDNTKSLLESYGDRIIPIFKSNTGKSHSRNTGLSAAKGSLIATLDSDDVWYPDYLEKAIDFLTNEKLDAVFSTCQLHKFKYQHFVNNTYHVFQYKEIREIVLNYCPAPTSGVVMQRTFIGDGWNNLTLEYEDWHLQIACVLKNKNCRVGYISEILWEKREDEVVRNKLKTTPQNQRRQWDTGILLNHLRDDLTKEENSIIQQYQVKDTIRLLIVLIKNRENLTKIWKEICFIFSKPTILVRIVSNALSNKIK
ncbi:glycosyltransferase family 2 protein [Arundinibacter roseus]|uniref:Glycosyltransferase n=1 Tax=Arundinibacter roseus TaxID=2070510 RepID=A0A4R4KKC9_9BACT|nr:glycosyltransferase family 2 protein [Arundinibacter roseus]TDB67392.1 glycosyltransferase [Arundinibacter roseus]